MSERADATEALFAEILADPRSEAARLVYADHLIERGDPRGELIQLQCRLEALRPDDPARRALARRAFDLLARHEPAWTRDVRALGFAEHLHQVTLRRGFVERIAITPAQHAAVAAVRARAPLREVRIALASAPGSAAAAELGALGAVVAPLEALVVPPATDLARRAFAAAFARWPRTGALRELDVSGAEIAEVVAADPALAGLTALRVGAFGTARAALATAAHLGSLRTLELSGGDAEGFARALPTGALANLTRLQLERCGLEAEGANALAAARCAPHLTHLRVHGNRDVGPAGAAAIVARCTALELLDLEATALAPEGLRSVLGAAQLARLRSLDLSRNPVEDRLLARAVARDLALPALRHLVLRGASAGIATAGALAAAPPLGALCSLDLSHNPLGDAGVTALAGGAALEGLEVLRLVETGVRAAGLRALGAGPRAPRLRTLDLGTNAVDDVGMRALLDGDHLEALVSLHLDDARLTARGVAALVASPVAARLESLAITGLTAGALAPLFAAELPELRAVVLDPLDDDLAAALAAARGLPRLHDLVLQARALTDAGARALAEAAELREVRSLRLGAPGVTEHGRARLRARFGHRLQLFAPTTVAQLTTFGRG